LARKNYLYLALTLACFLGIILIFVFDGYIGVYDSIVMDNGVFEQQVEADQWDDDRFGYLASTSTEGSSGIDFTYTLANRRFSAYEAPVAVTLWYGQDKIADLVAATLTAGAFSSAELTWSITTAEILPEGFPEDEYYNTVMVITRGEVERRIRVNIQPSLFKEITIPPPE
jgi:hypothetical protein